MRPRDLDATTAALTQPGARERFALCLLVALVRAIAEAPPGTIDDLLALLAAEEGRDAVAE